MPICIACAAQVRSWGSVTFHTRLKCIHTWRGRSRTNCAIATTRNDETTLTTRFTTQTRSPFQHDLGQFEASADYSDWDVTRTDSSCRWSESPEPRTAEQTASHFGERSVAPEAPSGCRVTSLKTCPPAAGEDFASRSTIVVKRYYSAAAAAAGAQSASSAGRKRLAAAGARSASRWTIRLTRYGVVAAPRTAGQTLVLAADGLPVTLDAAWFPAALAAALPLALAAPGLPLALAGLGTSSAAGIPTEQVPAPGRIGLRPQPVPLSGPFRCTGARTAVVRVTDTHPDSSPPSDVQWPPPG